MKLLVLSDSHSSLRFMRRCMEILKPDQVVHLGDHYDDGETLAEDYKNIPMHQVPGNCDRYRCPISAREILCYPVGGVRLYMTHGHRHMVKQGIGLLLKDARQEGAQGVLYGHTHVADCHREPDGLWVLNPGSAGSMGGSAGLMEIQDGKIAECRILTYKDLEEME